MKYQEHGRFVVCVIHQMPLGSSNEGEGVRWRGEFSVLKHLKERNYLGDKDTI